MNVYMIGVSISTAFLEGLLLENVRKKISKGLGIELKGVGKISFSHIKILNGQIFFSYNLKMPNTLEKKAVRKIIKGIEGQKKILELKLFAEIVPNNI